EIKLAKKQIEKLWGVDVDQFKEAGDFIMGIIRDFDSIKDGEHKAAVVSGMNLFVLALMDSHFEELSSFVLKNIENPDGRVREATRHVSAWLRMRHEDKLMKDAYERFLDKIEILMKKHEPAQKLKYIGDSPASIYKSIVLLWHNLSHCTPRDPEYRKLLAEQMEDDLLPFLGKEENEEEIDPDKILRDVWSDKADGDPWKAEKWLKKLEEMVAKRFEDELIRLGFRKDEAGIIMATLRTYGHRSEPGILDDMLHNITISRGVPRWADANNLTRAMEAYANHVVRENGNGQISHLLVEAIVERECSYSGKPDDLVVFLKLICQSHEAIDKFFERHEKDVKKFNLKMRNLFKEISDSSEEEGKYIAERDNEEEEEKYERLLGKSVAHHTLDWYIQADPGGFNRVKEPRKAAAYILIMTSERNMDLTDGKVSLHFDKKGLSKFGGWKGYESFSMVKYKVARPVLEMVGDPALLLIDPDKVVRKKSRMGW
ncbi:MAG: hypothetical protein NTZ38_03790, partial [Candidatus Taylorbacteria bacterium]|nr:hypothetical protein [Candidatus Taylorbacteria bacterium]